MAVRTLLPMAEATDTGFTLGAGANKVVAVQTSDGLTSYIERISTGAIQTYYVDSLPPGDAATIDANPACLMETSDNTADANKITHRIVLKQSGVYSTGTTQNSTNSFTQFTDNMAKPGGGSWLPSDFNGSVSGSIELGVQTLVYDVPSSLRCTFLKMDVTYTPAGGGYFYLLGCWLPPLIAAASHGLSLSEIARFYSRAKVKPSIREEYEMIRRAHLIRPRFVF